MKKIIILSVLFLSCTLFTETKEDRINILKYRICDNYRILEEIKMELFKGTRDLNKLYENVKYLSYIKDEIKNFERQYEFMAKKKFDRELCK